MFNHIINKIKRQMRNWKNNCHRDAKWLLSLPNTEITQIDKKNTTFSKKNSIFEKGI